MKKAVFQIEFTKLDFRRVRGWGRVYVKHSSSIPIDPSLSISFAIGFGSRKVSLELFLESKRKKESEWFAFEQTFFNEI